MTVRISDLAQAHTDLAATGSKLEKIRVLTNLLEGCDIEELPIVIASMTGVPRQGRFGVGWASMSQALDATSSGSEATTAIEVSADAAASGTPTIVEMDTLFDQLARTSGSGSVAARSTLLHSFIARCSESERSFLWKLVTGGLRQGALDGIMIDAVAKALRVPPASIRKAMTMHGDLGALATMIATDGVDTLDSVRVVVGRPMQPMLAATAASVEEALSAFETASIEWKLDGARIQVHLRRDPGVEPELKLFTRNLNDITDRLPEVSATLQQLDVESLVADGEVLGLDLDGNPAVFQDTMARVGSDESQPRHRVALQPFLFDLLHLNGEDLIDRPLADRLALLDRVASHLRVPGRLTDSLDVALDVQTEALGRGHEGVMVKDAASVYSAGRRGTAWRKVKPVHTFDLVVLGAEWGHGRRTGKLSNLHLGARDPEHAGQFVMVGKTFKGLTDELLAWQTDALLQREVRRTGITVFVRPELVVEIAIDGVQRSSRYPGGVALRFARVKGYRPDRDAETADTITSLQAMLGRTTS
jgi:DNA ligase 1